MKKGAAEIEQGKKGERFVYISTSGEGNLNLALDRYFLAEAGEHRSLLYFYINKKAVIIGKNQNVWRECALGEMERDRVELVRRHTGGGAVYHDEGNVNFSFIFPEEEYSVERQLGVIIDALASLGVKAGRSGRNDLISEGSKISGNAFGGAHGLLVHHGTLLVRSDLGALERYLTVSKEKIRSKAIASVRQRVRNISELAEVGTGQVISAIRAAYEREYGSTSELAPIVREKMPEKLKKLYSEQLSWEWRYGNSPLFDFTVEVRIDKGEFQLSLRLADGRVESAKCHTDALDGALAERLESALVGIKFGRDEICGAVASAGEPELAEKLRGELYAEL